MLCVTGVYVKDITNMILYLNVSCLSICSSCLYIQTNFCVIEILMHRCILHSSTINRSPNYMAPEVLCSGPVDVDEESEKCIQPITGPKADTWSLGMVLLQLILVGVSYSV